MISTTTMVATQYRLKEWAEQIKPCQNRPSGMRVEDWCHQNGITKANYYYRLRKVRESCLQNISDEIPVEAVVPVPAELMKAQTEPFSNGLEISVNGCSIHVTETTSPELLSAVLEVVKHA